jgi:alpha-ketoglutaric semialdehyde dehydrogenase
VGMHIVQHPLIKAIAFTGSFMGGKALYDAAASRPEPIPVYAEMGSTNPVFLLPGALRDNGTNIGTHLAASVTLGTGQFCTNPGVVFHVNDGSEKTFVNQLVEEIERKDPWLMLTSGIASAYSKGIDRLLQVPGMSLVAKGNGQTNTRTGLPHVLQSSVSHFLKQEPVDGGS